MRYTTAFVVTIAIAFGFALNGMDPIKSSMAATKVAHQRAIDEATEY